MPPVQTSAELVDALPAYILSDSVQDVADSVIAEHDAFRILNDIRMGYAERTDVKTEDDADIDTIIGVKKAGPLWGSLGEYDVVLWVNADWWHLMGKGAARAAAVTHALSHVLVSDEGKIKLVGHDVDAFIRETVKFGPWSTRLTRLWRSMGRDPAADAAAAVQEVAGLVEGMASALEAEGHEVTRNADGSAVVHIDAKRVRGLREASKQPPVVTP